MDKIGTFLGKIDKIFTYAITITKGNMSVMLSYFNFLFGQIELETQTEKPAVGCNQCDQSDLGNLIPFFTIHRFIPTNWFKK